MVCRSWRHSLPVSRKIIVNEPFRRKVMTVKSIYLLNSGESRISVRGMRRGSGLQFFSEEMTPTFYGRLLARIGVARIFQRVGAPRGGSRISGSGTMEGPKAPNEAQ